MKTLSKLKIINDPIYGFITIPSVLVFELIEHKYFQRLRRVSQMGFSYIVYPGAHHTRFHHALGAMFLMQKAVQVLRSKKINISKSEEEALYVAILLHDIGHGPFSHAMENSIVEGVSHEYISYQFMEALNKEFDQKLTLAIKIFKGEYSRKFFHQLVSGQLDMDRLVRVLKRAKYLIAQGVELPASEPLKYFLYNQIGKENFIVDVLNIFSKLDDSDIVSAMKQWIDNEDFVLRNLCDMLLNRDLLKIKIKSKTFPRKKIDEKLKQVSEKHQISEEDASYFVFTGKLENQAYSMQKDTINLLRRNGKIVDVAKASDQLNLEALSKSVVKYYMCYPKNNR